MEAFKRKLSALTSGLRAVPLVPVSPEQQVVRKPGPVLRLLDSQCGHEDRLEWCDHPASDR